MILKNIILYGAAILLAAHSANAGLTIVNPEDLKNEFTNAEVPSKLSNIGFGGLQKGTSRIGQVIAPMRGDGQGCEPYSWAEDFTDSELQHFDTNQGFFMMAMRGGCSFSQKVKNAHEFGAELVIISDYKDEATKLEQEANIQEDHEGLLQAHIPAFEIAWEDAKKLVEFVHQGGDKVVYMKASFDVTNEANTVEVDLWYASSLDLGLNLSTELAAMSHSFTPDHADKPLFTPRIATYSCLGCTDDFKEANCMSNGVYCSYTPNFYKEYKLQEKGIHMTGKETLMQALREKCLHKIMSEKYKDEGDLFFTFFGYTGACFTDMDVYNPDSHIDHPKSFEECYDWSTVQIKGNEEVGTLNACVDDSFAISGDVETDNSILREDRQWANANHIKLHPSVTINNSTFTNSTSEDLAMAICNAYREAPDECELSWKIKGFGDEAKKFDGLYTPHESDQLFEQSQNAQQLSERDSLFGSWHLYVIIAVILAINFAIMLVVRCRMKRQMRDQMNDSVTNAVTQYFALSSQENMA